jgi:tRNA1(Val) A37 N6-methylase TrmN6
MLNTSLASDQIRRFHAVLAGAGYSEEGLVETLGPIQLPSQRLQERAHFRYLTRRGRPLDFQIRLFLIGLPVPLAEATYALAPVPLAAWVEAGLIAIDETHAHGLVRMMAYRHLLLACDQLELQGTEAQLDAVMGVTASTAALADFAITRPCGAALDLGTGNGAVALTLAPRAERVRATDLSPRAVNFARFNAILNAAGSNLEILEGNAFEPVAGESFDLIVSNPPFAMTPSRRYLYRDSGLPADQFIQRLIETAPAYLNEGGYCQFVCQWAHLAGQDWKERLAGWFAKTACDAWVMVTDTENVSEYARIWIRDTEHTDPDESDRLYEEWLEYYEREKIEAISTGFVALRKASGRRNRTRFDDGPGSTSGPFGEYIALGFELGDFLETVSSDEALLEARLKVAASAQLDHVCELEDSAWRIRTAKLHLAQGLQYQANVDLRLAGMLALCDGQATMREILSRSAASLHVDFDRLAPPCLAITRHLIERGYVLPA